MDLKHPSNRNKNVVADDFSLIDIDFSTKYVKTKITHEVCLKPFLQNSTNRKGYTSHAFQ